MRLIDADSVLRGIDELKQSPWFNRGAIDYGVDGDFQHVGYIERKEAVETVRDLCIKGEPTVELTDEAAIEHLQASGWMQKHDYEMTRPGWISVKDRLPEKSGSYLCFMADYPFGPGYMIVNYRKEKGAFWWFEDNVKAPFITHWMPLPEVPKEDCDGHG